MMLRRVKLWSILGCLPQPGLLSNESPTSMRLNSFQLIKFCGTLTVLSPGTKSIGLRADALVPRLPTLPTGRQAAGRFFARHLDSFIVTRNLSSTYRDLVPFRQIIVTQNISSTYRVPIAIGRQKTRHRDPSLALWAGSDGT